MKEQRPITKEDESSQVPALQLLQNLGWIYLTPEAAMRQRKGSTRTVILEDILEKQLRKINKFEYKGELFNFSDTNVSNAISQIKEVSYEGIIKTSETIFDLVTLGKSYRENVRGDVKSYDFRYKFKSEIEDRLISTLNRYFKRCYCCFRILLYGQFYYVNVSLLLAGFKSNTSVMIIYDTIGYRKP